MGSLNLEQLRDELGAAMEVVVNDVRQKWRELNQGPGVLDSLRAFAAAVDWTERWIITLLATHVVLLVTVLALRKNSTVQGAVFVAIMAVVYNAERLNALAARHWRSFSRQNYFDKQGIFTSALLSGPLLVIMFAQLVNYLLAASSLLIQMKRRELAYRARQARREAAAAGAAGPKAGEPKKDK